MIEGMIGVKFWKHSAHNSCEWHLVVAGQIKERFACYACPVSGGHLNQEKIGRGFLYLGADIGQHVETG
jgi:hypothetical protein